MQLLGLFPLAFKRLWSRPWLSLLLVLTTSLIIGFTESIPVFANAVSRKILQDEIDIRSHTRGWPIFSVRVSARPDARTPMGVPEGLATRGWLGDMLRYWTALPLVSTYVELQSPMYRLAPRPGSSAYTSQYLAGVRVVHVPDIENHLLVTDGASYGQISDPSQLQVWLESSFAAKLALHVGDALELGDLYSTGSRGLPIIVAGFWEADPADALGGVGQEFWYRPAPAHFDGSLLVTADQFQQFVSARLEKGAELLFWYYVFDDTRLNFGYTDRYIGGLRQVAREVERRLPGGGMDFDPSEDLIRGRLRETSLLLILLGFSLPVLIIMISFLASLSATQTRFQESEIAIMVSRGATRGQMLVVAALESLFIVLAAIPPGLVLALDLAYILGFADGFLAFAARAPLQVSIYSLNRSAIVAVAGVSLIIRLISTWRASRTSLVIQERQRARPVALLTGARLIFLAFMVLTTFYAYRMLSGRGSLAPTSLSLLDPRRDPLLTLAPTLFIFVAPLAASELLVWLIRPADLIGRWLPWPSAYLALTNLARARGEYRAPAYRLILCLTLGVFYASLARSADIWLVDLLRHEYGADLTFRVGQTERNAFAGFSQATAGGDADAAAMLPSDEYLRIPGVAAAARVGDFEATISSAARIPYFRLLAVERTNFPQAAYFREDYAAEPLGELMNRLAQVPNGILLSHATADRMAVQPGDFLSVRVRLQADSWLQLNFKVVGFFNALPTVYPGGPPALVADLAYLELNTAGILPHTVWLRLAPGADAEPILREIRLRHVAPKEVHDLGQALAAEAQRLERTGIFGMLTVCFIAGVALAAADLLVYSTYRLRQRSRANAILRALGFERGTILRAALIEDAVTVGYSLAAGIACGACAAILYVPFYTLGRADGPTIPPLIPFIDWQRSDAIAIGVALTLMAVEALVLLRLQRQRIFEALRMGAPG